jgi:hypothetical protein
MGKIGKNDMNKEATLNYIDKLYVALDRASSALNRTLLITVTLSLIQLLAAAGWISTQGTVSLFGLSMRATFTVLLIASMSIIASLVVYSWSLMARMPSLHMEIIRLYENMFDAKERQAMDHPLRSALAPNIFIFVILEPYEIGENPWPNSDIEESHWPRRLLFFYSSALTYAVALSWLILPTVAEIAATLRLADILGWQQPWLWAPFLAFPLVTLTAPLAFLLRRQVRRIDSLGRRFDVENNTEQGQSDTDR